MGFASADAWSDALRLKLQSQLPDYMVPTAWVVLDELPRTPNGKLDNRALPEPGKAAADTYVEPATPTEQAVAELWATLLKRETVSATANFFALGGNSLLATRVVSAVAERLHKRVAVRSVFEHASVRAFAQHIDEQATTIHQPIPVVARDADLPLSFAQQRLWFIDELEGGTPQYNMPVAVRLRGRLDESALQSALDTLIARHEVLRTTYITQGEHAVQRIAPIEAVAIRRSAIDEASLDAFIAHEARQSFALGHEAPLRVSLLTLGSTDHVVLFTLHHIASDGWSMGLVIDEFVTSYEAAVGKTTPRLPALPVQYADYAQWQRTRLQGDALEQTLSYWRTHLAGLPAVHSLPLDHVRPAQQQFSGARLARQVDVSTKRQVEQLARKENATPFMLLQAVFALLLGRWSGEDDILIGTPVAGRTHRDVERLVGFFVNTLVLRTDLSGDPTFRTLLAQSRTNALAAQAHQELPFEMLVDALQPTRSLSHTPVFQIMFSLRNHVQGRRELSLPGLAVELVNPASDSVKFDLELVITESDDGLALDWIYATSLFDAATIARFAQAFERVLAAVVAAPDQRVQQIELLTDAERTPALRLGDAARRAGLVTQAFDTHVQATPDAAAVSCGDASLSYAELDARANQVAHVLRARRLRADDIVAICFERSAESLVAILGVLKAGAAYLPLDPSYPPDRLRYMLDDSRAVCVLSHRAAAAAVPAGDAPLLLLDDDAFAAAPTSAPEPDPHAGGLQLAYLIYTSGSTGQPKGVMVHHAGALNLARNLGRLFGAGTGDRVLQFASISFDAAVWDWLLALSRGACLVICPAEVRQSPEQLADFLVTQRITHATLPPALLPHLDAERAYALRALIVAGEACDAHSAWRWAARVPLFNAYGPTETSVCATITRVVPQQRITIGAALDNFELRVLNRAGVEQPVGVAGELQIGGIGVARGYLGRSELTAAAFGHDEHDPAVRRYRTGDRVRRLADDTFEFLGRIDEQVKLRGFRIELGEIEWQLRQCAGVRDVAVLVRGEATARRLVAYVVADPASASASATGLNRAVRAHLPEHMVPGAYVFLDALPLTVNGKLDKRALPEPPAPVADASSAPRNATERALCEIWQRLLRVPQVGIHDNFFAIGGDSILSTQVVARANQAGLRLTTRQMFEHQTIAELAEVVEGTHTAQAPQHAQTGALALTPIQRRFFAESAIEVDHYNQAVLLTTPADFDGACLPHLARALYERHDALRLAFTRERGEWTAHHRPLTLAMIEDTVAIERLPDDEEGDARCLAERGQHWQQSLDIAQARLWRLVHFEGQGRSGRLLIVVHHLVVDGVSWRVMLADLERAYRQYASGADVHLAAKTSAFAQWGDALRTLAHDAQLQTQADYWLSRYAVPVAPLPQDIATDTAPALATTERVNLSLSESDTRALLQRCGSVYRTQINELLLAGVYLGLQRWSGKHGVRVALEGHGREPLFDDLDVTETVGWFTTLYPLTLQADSVLPGDVIKAVKEQYRAVPGHGIGYGLLRHAAGNVALEAAEMTHGPQLVFNYLGQFDQSINAETLFQAADEYAGDKISAARSRPFLLGLSGRVLAGHLRLSLDYSNAQYRRATVQTLADCIEWGLQSVIHHCLSPQAGAFTPSDFPLASVSQQRLDVWQQQYPTLARLYPATPMQQGLLFESRNDRSAYVTQTYPLLRGRLDLALFRRAWDSVIARHDIFRTVFVGEDAELHQLVLQNATLPWQAFDWRALDADAQRERFAAFRREDKQQGFDFAAAPLMRIAVFQLDDERHQLLWTHHHMLLDGWCLPLVYREVMQVYDGLVEGRTPRLAAAPLYEHYMSWLARQSEARAEAYWRERLADIEATTSLSIDRLQRDVHAPREVRELSLTLDAAETARLQEWTRERRTTLNTVLQLAWAYLLHRYSNEARVAFGTIIAGRPAEVPGIEDMIGLFINTLPVVVDFSGDASTDALLARVQQDFQNSQDFAPLSLARIQRLAPLPPGMPLFDSLFVFENYPVDSALEGQRAQYLEVEHNTNDSQTSYPLTVIATLVHQLKLKCAYRADRFTDASITRLLGHLRAILLALTDARAPADLRAIDPIAADERAQLLAWAEPDGALVDAPAVPRLFDAQAQATPDAIALIGDDGSVSYRELDRRANRLAHWLRAQGAGSDVLIGLALPRSMDMAVAMLAVLKAGAAYVPLDPDYPAARLDYMRADSGVGIVLSRSDVGGNLATNGVQCIDAEDFTAALAALPDTAPALPADHGPRRLAYVMYTSGSTGQPKGVQVEHASIVRLVKSPNYLVLDRDTVFLQLASTAFDAATLEIWGALLNGGRVAFYPPGPADIAVLNRCLAQYRITTMFMTIGLFEQWSSALPADHALRYVMTGGDVISPRVMQRVVQGLPQTQIIACYGPTENTTYSSCHWLQRDETLNTVPLGRPINGTQVRVLSARRQLQPIGATGELFLGGTGLARGYLRRPELTAQRFVDDVVDSDATWYRTGDLVRMLEDGTLDFVRRADDQIKLRGFRIELGEIEAQLRELPQLRDVAVVVRGEGNDKEVVAYLVADAATVEHPDEAELRATLLRRLPAYMVPSAFVVLDALPLTVNGKLDRARLPAPERRASVFVAATTPTEAVLAEIWQAALKSGPVSVDANFFALGGHSLTAMKVASAIAAQLGVSLGIRDLFTYQTIAELGRFLDALAAETPVGAARTDEEREEMEW